MVPVVCQRASFFLKKKEALTSNFLNLFGLGRVEEDPKASLRRYKIAR